jgi:hypothetical protein
MADQYYFSQDNTPSGPFSAAEMRRLAAAGRIRPTDPVWKEGTGQSVLAARVKNLFPAQPPDVATTPPHQGPSAAAPPDPQATTPALQGAPPHGGPEEEPAAVLAKETPEAAGPLPGTPTGMAVEKALAPPAAAAARRASQPPARQKRVVAIKGAVLTGQDGVHVQFRKKCETCGHEDGCRSTAIIRLGSSRVPFFCPKCRRPRAVEITAVG